MRDREEGKKDREMDKKYYMDQKKGSYLSGIDEYTPKSCFMFLFKSK